MDVSEMIEKADEATKEAVTFDAFQEKLIEIFEENEVEFYWFSDTCFFVVYRGFYRYDCDIQRLTVFDSEKEFLESLEYIDPHAVEIYKWEKEWKE